MPASDVHPSGRCRGLITIALRALACCCVWHAVAAGAQTLAAPVGADFDPRKDARAHAGGVYFTPTFRLENLGIDSNVFNTTDDPKSDFTATFTPGVQVWMPIQRRA